MDKQQLHEMPSFVKVFHGGLVRELKIPDPFVDQHSQNLPAKLALMPRYGNPVVVSIERRTKGQCFFTLGWTDFVAENGVEEGDFLFFYFHGDRSVTVVVYDLLGCLKGVKETEQGSAVAAPRTGKRVKTAASGKKSTSFDVIYKSYLWRYMRMPTGFPESAGLKIGGKALVQDPKGKVWSISITAGDTEGRKMRLSKGWLQFVRENEIEDGDALSFFLKPSLGLIQVKIQKEGVIVID
ncbi:Putative B3 domain-containing protein Os03g0621600 [Linum grandiflorum]